MIDAFVSEVVVGTCEPAWTHLLSEFPHTCHTYRPPLPLPVPRLPAWIPAGLWLSVSLGLPLFQSSRSAHVRLTFSPGVNSFLSRLVRSRLRVSICLRIVHSLLFTTIIIAFFRPYSSAPFHMLPLPTFITSSGQPLALRLFNCWLTFPWPFGVLFFIWLLSRCRLCRLGCLRICVVVVACLRLRVVLLVPCILLGVWIVPSVLTCLAWLRVHWHHRPLDLIFVIAWWIGSCLSAINSRLIFFCWSVVYSGLIFI